MEPTLIQSVANLKLVNDLRNRIIHGYGSVDDEIVYVTAVEDIPSLLLDLTHLLVLRG